MLQELRSCHFYRRRGMRFRRVFSFGPVFACVALCIPAAWSQTLQAVTPITPFGATQVTSSSQQNVTLQVTGAPISISSFSFANSQGGFAEYVVGTVTGCVVDGSTLDPVGTTCTIPITFQPAYPGVRQAPLIAVTSGGTFYFGMNGTGLGVQASLTPGTLSTVAGTGVAGDTGDNAAATGATLNQPARTAVDYQGNIFIADSGNNVVREVVASTGNILVRAGNGTACSTPAAACGDGGAAGSANLFHPSSVAVDASGNLYIADSGDNRIRRVDASTGIITTVAGTGGAAYGGDGGQATAASIGNPQQVIVDFAGNLYIAAAGDNAIRYVAAASGVITTLAGNGTACAPATATCGDGGAAAGGASQLNAPTGVARDAAGNLYIADSGDNRVRRIDAMSGAISTVAGSGILGYTGDTNIATDAEFNGVYGVDVDPAGNLYLADRGNAAVRIVLSATGKIFTVAGNGVACASATATCGDGGVSTGANLIAPQSAALDSVGNLYIADSGGNRVRKVYVFEPTFIFAPTMAGSGSASNPETVLLTNIGNQALTVGPPSSGTNPSFPNGFSFDNAASFCPLLTPSSSAAALPAGYGCVYAIDFTPPSAGNFSGAVTFSSSSLNDPSQSQSVLVMGTGLQISGANTLSSSTASPAYGNSVTFTDTIPVGGGIAPTGTVSFYNGGTLLGSVAADSSGTQTFTLASLPVGTDSITAVYSGDANYAAVTSNAVVETVGSPATTATSTTLASSANPSTYGQSIDLTATVGYPGGAVPTGSATFYAPGASTTINLQATATSTTLSQTLSLAAGTYSVSILGAANGGLYNGWNPASSPSSNNQWTDRYGIALCATCSALINDIAGDPGYGTDALALSAFQAAPSLNMTLAVASQGQTVGNPYTFTLASPQSVSFYIPDGAFANGAFTDTSSFADDSGGLSLAVTPLTSIGTATVDSSGVATFTTSALAVGTNPVQAVYSGDTTYVSSASVVLNQVVNKGITSGTLTSSNATPIIGQTVTFTETLPAANATYPTGTVTFYNGSTAIGTGTLTNGVATLTTSALPAGSDAITASYPGDANFEAGTSNSLTETVGKSAAPDALTASTATSGFGQSVTFTDTIPTVSGYPPTGSVTFYNGSTVLGTGAVSASGVASLTTALLPAGSDSITAIFGGDANYAVVTSNAVIVTVYKANGADTLTTSNASPSLGQSVTLTDTIPVIVGVSPTGTVTFYNGTTAIGTVPVDASGVAMFAIGSLPPGADSITAVYSGDSNYASVTAGPITENVARSSVPDTLTTSNPSIVLGQSVTFTDTIPVVGANPPTGMVTFYNATTAIGSGTINASGMASLTLNTLPAGANAITVVYLGDSNYISANAGPLTETVARSTEPDVLTASNASPTLGEPVTFTDTIPVAGGIAPTGTVTFYNGATAIGTGTVSPSGIATLTTNALPVGTDSITAVYGGDANYASVTSNAVAVSVSKAAASSALTASAAAVGFGQPVTFTDTLSGVAGIVSTGTVTFYNGATILGTAAVTAPGSATLTNSSLPVGTNSITAVYSGDGNYTAVTSNAVSVSVSKAGGAALLTSSNPSPTFGQTITFTDSVPVTAGTAPTGTVTFYNRTVVIGTGAINASGIATLSISTLPVGTDSITAVYGGDGNYAAVTSNAVIENITKSGAASTLTASAVTSVLGQAVTFADTLTAAAGIAPSGTVTFYDGATALGTSTVDPSGAATFTTTSLLIGSHSITAVYSGDPQYLASTSNAVVVIVILGDFAISATPAELAGNPGQSASYTVSLTGLAGPFNQAIVLSATGLPTGATVTFDPASVTPGAATVTTTMTVATSPTQAALHHPGSDRSGVSRIGYALLLLPLFAWRRFRAKLAGLPQSALLLLILFLSLNAITGCGAGGYFGPPPSPYTITVTGTSGSLQHTVTVTLTVR